MLTPEAKTELEQQKSQISEYEKKNLVKQQYRVVGNHSAVKPCGWTKTMIRGKGGCYKLKFYGIRSHQCLQMTTSMSCANRCTFCWRGYKAPVSKEWKWGVDNPQEIFEGSIQAHHQLLIGFQGSDKANKQFVEESKEVKHVALSLTGEPIIYPQINELIELFNQKGISTFLVTNAQYPEQIKNLKPITQLYLSLDAPTKELLKEIDQPLFADYWERLNQSLDYLAEKKERTAIRVTVIKGINDNHLEQWAEMILKGSPDFIEVKSYMFVGESRQRLKKENMPLHEEIVDFSKKLVELLPDYEIMGEHIPSRVTCIVKKKFKREDGWYTWLDFEQWNKLVNSGEEFTADDYSRKTPETGISGKGTLDNMSEHVRKKHEIDEKTPEIEFWDEKKRF